MRQLLAIAAILLIAWQEPGRAQDSVVKSVERAFKRVERTVCNSIDIKCKPKPQSRTQADAAGRPPKPRQRPASMAKTAKPQPQAPKQLAAIAESKTKVEAEERVAPERVPVPKLRSGPQATKPAIAKPAEIKNAGLQQPKPKPPLTKTDPQLLSCTRELARLGASTTPATIPASAGTCNVANAVQLSAVKTLGKAIEFPDKPVLSCEFAAVFAGWSRNVAAPLVKATTGSALTAIATGPGFDCRGRNGDGSAKLSEHASGNAVDITFVKTADGRMLQVKDLGGTVKALRASACELFTTVLGPGSNTAHADHLHLDMANRKGGYRICQ